MTAVPDLFAPDAAEPLASVYPFNEPGAGVECVSGGRDTVRVGGFVSVPSDPAQRTERTVRRLAMVEYKVVELRERMWGGAQAGQELEKVLNKHAREGWQLKAITRADVKGRVGRGAVEGLIITMERQN